MDPRAPGSFPVASLLWVAANSDSQSLLYLGSGGFGARPRRFPWDLGWLCSGSLKGSNMADTSQLATGGTSEDPEQSWGRGSLREAPFRACLWSSKTVSSHQTRPVGGLQKGGQGSKGTLRWKDTKAPGDGQFKHSRMSSHLSWDIKIPQVYVCLTRQRLPEPSRPPWFLCISDRILKCWTTWESLKTVLKLVQHAKSWALLPDRVYPRTFIFNNLSQR